MILRHLWEEHVCGVWTENRLLSRKWWLVAGTVPLVVILDVSGHPLRDSTLTFMQYVITAYLTVQGALDFWRYRASLKKKEGNRE